MRVVGRIISRGSVTGLFIPMDKGQTMPVGIYEIREIMGELVVTYVGKPALKEQRLTGLDLDGVFAEKEMAAMTAEELSRVTYKEKTEG